MKESLYKWNLNEDVEQSNSLIPELDKLKINAELAPLLWRRGMTDPNNINSYLKPTVANFHDPFLLFDMEKSVERIQKAVESGETILVYGDYDADGITSTTVMKEAIELIGGNVSYYLPNRFTDGYGPNIDVYRRMIEEEGVQLIVTVDNGVSGHEAIEYANSKGIDVIITDHHELPEELPKAFSVIHPRHPQGNYPFNDLAGVGVAFKVATALLGEIPIESLDLVAIGTIADLVSLTDENRALVKIGLEIMKQSERVGLNALADVSKVDLLEATEETVGFTIAPRLNAIGRLGDASPGVELLSTFDEVEAANIATFIQQKNTERQSIVKEITTEALEMAKNNTEDSILFLINKNWHQGVLGIVASRIVQETHKPTIVLNLDEATGFLKGSGRSVQGIDLFQVLSSAKSDLESFGGHHMAAGVTFHQDQLVSVKSKVNQAIQDLGISSSEKEELLIDGVLSIETINVEFIERLKLLAPFGTDNPAPYFLIKSDKLQNLKQIGADNAHLKCQLNKKELAVDCIAFNRGMELHEFEYADEIEVVGQLSINEWNGFRKPQVMLSDYAISDWQIFDARGKKKLEIKPQTDNVAYLVFEEKVYSKIIEKTGHTYLVDSIDKDFMKIINGYDEVVIVDCPYDLTKAKLIFSQLKVARIYFEVNVIQEHYLTGLPSREQFGQLFKLIASQESIDIRHKLKEISAYLKINKNLLIFMINVFFDLGFVTIDDGLMTKVQNPVNKPLQESKIYQNYQKKIEMEKLFLYSDIKEIKQWILQQEEIK
ncbi:MULTISPECIES: single-stranded-DNA-specific exonuclease RecJ [Vagococcus]|uniref:Single-stranded-DNA-specific exonuclease RecJ n=1 Tax=Vagococcus fluvialis bH819 TaxID=1255619 RepID=A0A1X6WNZ3_9ENTE|nr:MULTISPECIES: single-stranded-DNA-specific exonuclease RecJ [Vagococcus]SLM85978.1 Single-stranded-DNA-specific exonuclease RecJ [Vagococcus fluvialis bH819]HCM88345.1 single-stranded-DNA-specific exonuclease RecJ [Vagococcus sp.]